MIEMKGKIFRGSFEIFIEMLRDVAYVANETLFYIILNEEHFIEACGFLIQPDSICSRAKVYGVSNT